MVAAVSGDSPLTPAATESDALESHIGAMTDRELLEAIYRHILTAEGAVSGIHRQVGPMLEKIQESPIMQMFSM